MNLTVGEAFYLWRRRRGYSEHAAAIAIGCSRSTVRLIESGHTQPWKWFPRGALPRTWSPGEEIRILRKRAELKAEELGTLLDVGRNTVYRIERDEVSISDAERRSIGKSLEYATRFQGPSI